MNPNVPACKWCGQSFYMAEDFRDHEPCHMHPDEIAKREARRLATLEPGDEVWVRGKVQSAGYDETEGMEVVDVIFQGRVCATRVPIDSIKPAKE